MAVWKLKICPLCNRNLLILREISAWYGVCLTCGYNKDISHLVTVNTVGQAKITCTIESEQDLSTDVTATHKDGYFEQS